MSKALRITLALAILISAAANAPGLLLALANSQEADPAEAQSKSSVAPLDYYAYDYDYDTTAADPGAWLDALFLAADNTAVASWRHTWTDFEVPPTADVLNPYRRPAHWEPEGVLFAYLSTFSDVGYTDLREHFADSSSPSMVKSVWLTGFGVGAVNAGQNEEGKGVEVPADEPGPGPDNNPPPPEEMPPPDLPDTTPPPSNPPVNVPEPASMSLFALALTGLFVFGKRRRVGARVRNTRDRA